MIRKKKTRSIPRSAGKEYLGKAREFAESMRENLTAKRWDASGLAALHTVISASDAILSVYGGLRSAAEDHRAVAALLEDTIGKPAKKARRHILAVISKKNVVEYEQRHLTEREARDTAAHAERFLRFAEEMLGK